MKKVLLFVVFISLFISGCSKSTDSGGGGYNDDNDNPTHTVTPTMELLSSDIVYDFFITREMDVASDGEGGFYFMDWHNSGAPEQQIILWNGDEFTATGLTPSWFIDAMGFETGFGEFDDISTDGEGNLYIIINFESDGQYLSIFYKERGSETIYYFADTDAMASIISSAGLSMGGVNSVKTRMQVTEDKNLWLVACDTEDNLAIIYMDTGGDEIQVSSWTMSETDYWSFYDNFKLGLGNDGDLLLTDCEHGTVWRCDPQTGPEPYISLENFPQTMSAFTELDDGSLVFASNYVTDIDITFIHDGYGDIVEVITGIFAEGYDRLFYALPSGDGWELFYWDASDIVETMGRDGIPLFWHFHIDPFDGKILLCDEEYGDVYKLEFNVQPVLF